ncbi:MAG: TolC family protein [Leptothrix sp. (in: b-proteobacteria)]
MRFSPLSAVLAVLLLSWGAAQATETNLSTLEGWAIESAPELRLARAQADIETQRLDAAAARLGPRLTGATGVAAGREVVSEISTYDARRLTAQAALRWPLAGNVEAQRRERKEIEAAVVRAQLRTEQVRREVLRQLRAAYAEHAAAQQQARLAAAYLSWQHLTLPVLHERTQAGLLLEADRLGYEVAFTSAQTTHARQLLRVSLARRTLERLTGRTLPELSTAPPVVPTACLQAPVLAQAADLRPDIASASTDVQLRRELVGYGRMEGIDAGVTLAQNVAREVGGRTGWSTSVGLDMSMPLNWQEQRDAESARRRIELALAEELLGIRRADDQRNLDTLLDTVTLRRRESVSAADRVLSALEVWRVARLQAERIAGDPLERALQTRLTLFHAGIELSETELRRWLAELEGPALAPDCAQTTPHVSTSAPATAETTPPTDAAAPLDNTTEIERITDTFERTVGELNRPRRLPGEKASSKPATAPNAALASVRESTGPAPLSAAICPSAPDGSEAAQTTGAATRLAWFVWDSAGLLAAPQQLAELPTSSQRLWLSFSPAQINELDNPAAVGGVKRFIDAARACGLQVELLFGDPDAVRPDSHARIVSTLNRLLALGFSGLVLDLERDQLPAADRSHWADWTLALLREWHASNMGPVVLVTHHRELVDGQFVEQLAAAGVNELVPMIYIADTAAAARQAEQVLASAGTLPVTVAQSIEATLPPSESVHSLGRTLALARWQALAQALSADHAGLRAIAVQSLEDYLRSTP